MHKNFDKFDQDSPEKVFTNANLFTKTFSKMSSMPASIYKKEELEDLAEYNKTSVRYAIDQSRYQKNLFRKLENEDHMKRLSIQQKLTVKDKEVHKNLLDLEKKKEKEVERVNKHLKQVYKKHVNIQRSKKNTKDDEAFRLRKELMSFYTKQKERKKQSDSLQIKVAPCYKNAINRIDKLHQFNQQYALKSQKQHNEKMARNSNLAQNLIERSRAKSSQNTMKEIIYDKNNRIFNQKEEHFLQVLCKDLNQSNKAFDHKQDQNKKSEERIKKFFKERVEKWSTSKRRVDAEKERVPDRCLGLMDKSTKASFRQTMSTFKSSSKDWYNRVQMNKSAIYERDEKAKDVIMRNHLDMRLKNSAAGNINEQMGAMKNHAKKLAYEFN